MGGGGAGVLGGCFGLVLDSFGWLLMLALLDVCLGVDCWFADLVWISLSKLDEILGIVFLLITD